MTDYKKTFGIKGRVRRKYYIFAQILVLALTILFLLTIMDHRVNSNNALAGTLTIVFLGLALFILITTTVKRLHDAGLNPLLSLLVVVPSINFIFVLVLCFLPGQKGENPFGPDPRVTDNESEVKLKM
jgi:uncharacterized membrane protein YhaH (DUF805 family)